MKVSHVILAFLFVLAVAIEEGLTLQCYSCNSFEDQDCFTITEKTRIETCGVNETMCRKVEQEVYFNKKDHTRVFRQCATSGDLGDCLERTGTYRFKSYYCQCKGQLCNGAGGVTMSVSLTVAMIATLLGLRKCL